MDLLPWSVLIFTHKTMIIFSSIFSNGFCIIISIRARTKCNHIVFSQFDFFRLFEYTDNRHTHTLTTSLYYRIHNAYRLRVDLLLLVALSTPLSGTNVLRIMLYIVPFVYEYINICTWLNAFRL